MLQTLFAQTAMHIVPGDVGGAKAFDIHLMNAKSLWLCPRGCPGPCGLLTYMGVVPSALKIWLWVGILYSGGTGPLYRIKSAEGFSLEFCVLTD